MKDPDDLRPDDVYAYVLGQVDSDRVVEGYNEYTDDPETSSDLSHNWHLHDSFRRRIIGNFWAMWKALTIDMGWTYAEWLESTTTDEKEDDSMAGITQAEFNTRMDTWWNDRMKSTQVPVGDELAALRRAPWNLVVNKDTGDTMFQWMAKAAAAGPAVLALAEAFQEFVSREDADDEVAQAKLDEIKALLVPVQQP
jgi:hypothetical protein